MHWPKGQKVKGQGHTVTKTVTDAQLLVTRAGTAVCCCCRRGSACRYDCLCFLVKFNFQYAPKHVLKYQNAKIPGYFQWIIHRGFEASHRSLRYLSDFTLTAKLFYIVGEKWSCQNFQYNDRQIFRDFSYLMSMVPRAFYAQMMTFRLIPAITTIKSVLKAGYSDFWSFKIKCIIK